MVGGCLQCEKGCLHQLVMSAPGLGETKGEPQVENLTLYIISLNFNLSIFVKKEKMPYHFVKIDLVYTLPHEVKENLFLQDFHPYSCHPSIYLK